MSLLALKWRKYCHLWISLLQETVVLKLDLLEATWRQVLKSVITRVWEEELQKKSLPVSVFLYQSPVLEPRNKAMENLA